MKNWWRRLTLGQRQSIVGFIVGNTVGVVASVALGFGDSTIVGAAAGVLTALLFVALGTPKRRKMEARAAVEPTSDADRDAAWERLRNEGK